MPSEELYDIIQVKEKPLVMARAVRNVQNVQNVQYQQNAASEPLPTRLPKSNRAPTVSNLDKTQGILLSWVDKSRCL